MQGKWALLAGLAVLLTIAGGTLIVVHRALTKPAPPETQPPAPVDQAPELSLSGRIQARDVVVVEPPIEGTIDEFFVEVGEEVAEGQLLGRILNQSLEETRKIAVADMERARDKVSQIESAILAARLEASRARADASRARGELDRLEKLYRRQEFLQREGATPRLVFEKAQQDFTVAQTQFTSLDEIARQAESRVEELLKSLDAAKRVVDEKNEELEVATQELKATEVTSPVDGIVTARRGNPGEEVRRGSGELFQIAVDVGRLEVVLQPDPAQIRRIRNGQAAMILLAEYPQGIPAEVARVQDGAVYLHFEAPDPAVRPGMTAQVRIRVQ